MVGINNFNDYYDPTLKRSRQALLERSGVFIVEGDINDMTLLKKLFELMTFTHVLHLAAQAGVRYAMENPLYAILAYVSLAWGPFDKKYFFPFSNGLLLLVSPRGNQLQNFLIHLKR